jgi:hypothetical protein
VSEESFARAQQILHENKMQSRRRTITPSVVQGLVSCQKCGYAFSRTSTYTTARKLHYYKCIGSDSWRKLGGPVCDNRMVRQDLLDQIVWTEVIRLLEDPTLIQQELDRRLTAARSSDPTRKREQNLQRELIRVGKGIERLLTAYQEELLSLEQLRERMPALRQREHTLRAELQAIADQATDRATFLRLAETLTTFLTRLRSAADTLDIIERQRIVRLVVKDILIGEDSIVIRHCIPVGLAPPSDSGQPTPGKSHGVPGGQSYLLRSGSNHDALGRLYRLYQKQHQQQQNRLEAALTRHWPELTGYLDLDSVTLEDLLLSFGSPAALSARAEEGRERMRRVSRGKLATLKIEAVIKSARQTIGVPCVAAERDYLMALGAELRHSREEKERVGSRLAALSEADPALHALGVTLGRVTTGLLIAEGLDPRAYANSKSYCKAFGLNLKERSSGQHKGRLKITKRGSGEARRDLYLATLRLIQRNEIVSAWYEKKVRAQGGRYKQKIAVGLMRKLSRSLWYLARGQVFDARKLCAVG